MAHEGVVADLARLVALYDRHDVRDGDPREGGPTPADVAAFDEVLAETNRLLDQVRLVSAYLYTFISTDSSNDTAAGLRSRLQSELTDLTRLTKRFEGWTARLGVGRAGGGQRGRGRPRLPARAGRRRGRAPDDARPRRGSPPTCASRAAWRGPGCTASHLAADRPGGRRRRQGRDAADERRARAGHTTPTPTVRRAAYDAELAAVGRP